MADSIASLSWFKAVKEGFKHAKTEQHSLIMYIQYCFKVLKDHADDIIELIFN